MAGMRPCGTIVLMSELFISESLPQVYGTLHQFYASNPTSASKISKLHALFSRAHFREGYWYVNYLQNIFAMMMPVTLQSLQRMCRDLN